MNKIEKEKIEKRLEELKKQNDQSNQFIEKANQEIANIRNEIQKVISEALIRNGRILELEEMLKSTE